MTQLLQTSSFARDWKKLTPETRTYLAAYLIYFNTEPKRLDIKRLQGPGECYRLRCGEYRIIFRRTTLGIQLLKVAHRKDIYR